MSQPSSAQAQRPLRRKWYQWLLLLAALAVSAAAIAAALALFQMNRAAGSLGRLDLTGVLADPPDDTEPVNVMLMGFDSESVLDLEDPLRSSSLDAQRQAKMIWLLRIDPSDESLSLLSIDPRTEVRAGVTADSREPGLGVAVGQLVPVAGVGGAIQALQSTLGIDVHHYVEMDVRSISALVDAVGGVPVYVPSPLRDDGTGFVADVQGCVVFDGESARRYLQATELVGEVDGAFADMESVPGRSSIERERDFLASLLRELPTGATEIVSRYRFWEATADAITVDLAVTRGQLVDRVAAAREYQDRQFFGFTLPIQRLPEGDASASAPVIFGTETNGMLAVFRGEAGPSTDEARSRALRPGMTGLRSITCRM